MIVFMFDENTTFRTRTITTLPTCRLMVATMSNMIVVFIYVVLVTFTDELTLVSIISVILRSVLESTLRIQGLVRGPWKRARTRRLSIDKVVLVNSVITVPTRCTPSMTPLAVWE